MKKSVRSDVERFNRELSEYRSTINNLRADQERSPIDIQLSFWVESARFCITELEIWGKLDNDEKYVATFYKVQKILGHLDALINQLIEEGEIDLDEDE